MFYLDVAKDGSRETLRFASKHDVARFVDFINVYVDDSGAGNGYGSYWMFMAKPYWRPYKLRDSTTKLDPEIISRMFASILRARLAINDTSQTSQTLLQWLWTWSIVDKGIIFRMEPLPPRQRPTVGDMYRIPRSQLLPDGSDFVYSEGRVLTEKDGILTVRPCQDEDSATGEWRDDKKITYAVEVHRTMKINDWLSAMRHPSAKEQG